MFRILFIGKKSFWKTRNTVEITIIQYQNFDILEVIVVDVIEKFEADRIFLDALAVYARLEARQKEYSEIMFESGIVVKTESVTDQEISSFICKHLFIKEYLPVSRTMKVEVRSTFAEEEHNELMIPRPPELPLSDSPNSVACGFLDPHTSPPTPVLDDRRQPLIFTRVSHGLPLTEADAQIWARFAANKTQRELVESMAKALVNRIPGDEHVLQSAAHAAIMLPAQTPFPAPRFKPPSAVTLPLDLVVAATSSRRMVSSKIPSRQHVSGGVSGAGRSRRSNLKELLGFSFGVNDPSHRISAATAGINPSTICPFPVANSAAEGSGLPLISPLLDSLGVTLHRSLCLRSARSCDDCKVQSPTARIAFGSPVEYGDTLGAFAGREVSDDEAPAGRSLAKFLGLASGSEGPPAIMRRRTIDNSGGAPILLTGAVTAKKQHRRGGSGGFPFGIAVASNRVQPAAFVADDAELDLA